MRPISKTDVNTAYNEFIGQVITKMESGSSYLYLSTETLDVINRLFIQEKEKQNVKPE